MNINVKIRTVLIILKYLKLLIFCSFLAILCKLLLSTFKLIKKGSANSIRYLVASLMCSGGTCSKYGLNVEDEESFTTEEIYYGTDDNDQTRFSNTRTDENGEDSGSEILLEKSLPYAKRETCESYTAACYSEETGSEQERRAFSRHRSHKRQSDFRKLALPGAIELHDYQQQSY